MTTGIWDDIWRDFVQAIENLGGRRAPEDHCSGSGKFRWRG
jgi:hypothetical protein